MKPIAQLLLDKVLLTSPAPPVLSDPTTIGVQLFGNFQLYANAQPLQLSLAGRPLELLACLLLHNRQVHKRALARHLWVYGGESALNSLHQTVFKLRKSLKSYVGTSQLLQRVRDTYQLNRNVALRIDWFELRALINRASKLPAGNEQARLWIEAYDYCRSPLLENIDENVEWLLPYRQEARMLRQLVMGHLIRLAQEWQLPVVVSLLKTKMAPGEM